MPLAQGLAAGLQTYTGIMGERRRQEAHSAQLQSLELRNQHQGVQNMLLDDTYDSLVQKRHAEGRSADYKAESDRIAALVAANVAPWTVHKAEFDARKAEQGLYTEQNRTVKEGNLAATAGSKARVAIGTEQSEIAATNQKNWTEQQQQSREAISMVQEDLAQTFESYDYDIGEAINTSPKAKGDILGLARAMSLDADDVVFQDGEVHFLNADGEVEDSLGEQEFMALMLDADSMSEVIEGAAQLGRAEEPHIQRAQQGMGEAAEDRQADQAEYDDAIGTFAEHGAALSDLQRLTEDLRAAEQRRVESSDRVGRGAQSDDPMIGGFDRDAPDLRAESAELEEEIQTLSTGLREAGISDEYLAHPGRLQQRIQTLENSLADNQPGGDREQQVRQTLGGGLRDTRRALRAGVDHEDVIQRQAGTGSSALGLDAREGLRGERMAPIEAAGEMIDKVVDETLSAQGQMPAKDRDERLLDRAGDARRDLHRLLAVDDRLARMLHEDPQARARLGSVFRDAVATQAESGQSAAISIYGAIRDDRPEITAAMHSVLDDHQLLRGKRFTQEEQLDLAFMAGEQMRSQISRRENLSEDRAVRAALRQMGR